MLNLREGHALVEFEYLHNIGIKGMNCITKWRPPWFTGELVNSYQRKRAPIVPNRGSQLQGKPWRTKGGLRIKAWKH